MTRPDFPAFRQCNAYRGRRECVCPEEERALRAFAYGDANMAMTDRQREWCLKEIGAVEGYRQADHENDSDSNLARIVLEAWQDYCRDKGVL